MKKKKIVLVFVSIFLALSIATGITVGALAGGGSNESGPKAQGEIIRDGGGTPVGDYLHTRPDIAGSKIRVVDPKFAEKSWVEYLEYAYLNEQTDEEYVYKFYDPSDYALAAIMEVASYVPENLENEKQVQCTFSEMIPFFTAVGLGNAGVGLVGGAQAGIYGLITQEVFLNLNAKELIANSQYYADEYFTGLSNDHYYSMDSMSITIEENIGYQIEKTKNMDYTFTTGGGSNMELDFWAVTASVQSKIESALNYGINFNEGQNGSKGVSKSITFNAREDEEVKNIPWRLVEFTAKVPIKVEIYKIGIEDIAEEFYMSYNLLSGVVREFANGYIEHWNTGKLVLRADFFEGFCTPEQLVAAVKDKNTERFDDSPEW